MRPPGALLLLLAFSLCGTSQAQTCSISQTGCSADADATSCTTGADTTKLKCNTPPTAGYVTDSDGHLTGQNAARSLLRAAA